MKQDFPPHRRAFVALIPTLALLAVPAVAQETPAPAAPQQSTPVAPPPVPEVAPVQAAPVAPAPVQAAPVQPPVQTVETPPVEAPPPPDAAPAPRATAATRSAPRTAPTHHVTQEKTTHTTAAPVVAPPANTPAPVAAVPETTPAVTPATPPVDQTRSATTTDTRTTAPAADTSTGFNWRSPWLALAGVVLIALLGLILLGRRRRADENYDEPVVHEEPVYQPAPVTAEPIVAPVAVKRPDAQFLRREASPVAEAPRHAASAAAFDEASLAAAAGTEELVAPDANDVEALTAGDAPVADRPWLEMAMRPLRAGTNVDEAVVEIELTVGNAGSVAADGVRISTFMFAGAPADDEMERLLLEREDDGVPAVRIKPGEGRTLEATLALPRAALNGSVSPVIVAEARYPLADGGEGRTAASFRIGVSDDGGAMTPIPIGRPHMHDEVSAELVGVPEHS